LSISQRLIFYSLYNSDHNLQAWQHIFFALFMRQIPAVWLAAILFSFSSSSKELKISRILS